MPSWARWPCPIACRSSSSPGRTALGRIAHVGRCGPRFAARIVRSDEANAFQLCLLGDAERRESYKLGPELRPSTAVRGRSLQGPQRARTLTAPRRVSPPGCAHCWGECSVSGVRGRGAAGVISAWPFCRLDSMASGPNRARRPENVPNWCGQGMFLGLPGGGDSARRMGHGLLSRCHNSHGGSVGGDGADGVGPRFPLTRTRSWYTCLPDRGVPRRGGGRLRRKSFVKLRLCGHVSTPKTSIPPVGTGLYHGRQVGRGPAGGRGVGRAFAAGGAWADVERVGRWPNVAAPRAMSWPKPRQPPWTPARPELGVEAPHRRPC